MPVTDTRSSCRQVAHARRCVARSHGIEGWGCQLAGILDADDLDPLIAAAEDLADVEAAHAAREELDAGDTAVPWAQVKADLGLA